MHDSGLKFRMHSVDLGLEQVLALILGFGQIRFNTRAKVKSGTDRWGVGG